MIEEGKLTLLGIVPYDCVKIENGVAYLKKVGDETRGRFKKMDAVLVPYFDEEKGLIVPKKSLPSRKKMLRFHYLKAIKEEVDLPLSNDLAYFVAEQLDTIIRDLAAKAQQNAEYRNDSRITPNHWYNLQLGMHQGDGYWPIHRELAKEYKEYLRE